jgi:hypothetical protein
VNLESKFKTALVDECRELGAYARRHEDRFALGLLDMSIKFPGYPHLMAEGKLVHHQKFAPTLRQWVEGENYQAAGGLCCLIGFDPKTKLMYVHRWAKEASKSASLVGSRSASTIREWLEHGR